jgi:hypothetical protein
MLPLGFLGPAPGWGKPRPTRLSRDEQRTLMTLWCIFPSPLMVGGDLTKADEWTTSLLTNREVLEVDQHSTGNRLAVSSGDLMIWVAEARDNPAKHYVAVFNRSESAVTRNYSWKDLRLPGGSHGLRNLWEQKDLEPASQLSLTLGPHASALYAVKAGVSSNR